MDALRRCRKYPCAYRRTGTASCAGRCIARYLWRIGSNTRATRLAFPDQHDRSIHLRWDCDSICLRGVGSKLLPSKARREHRSTRSPETLSSPLHVFRNILACENVQGSTKKFGFDEFWLPPMDSLALQIKMIRRFSTEIPTSFPTGETRIRIPICCALSSNSGAISDKADRQSA
jgi:hypothetical protein